MRDAGSHLDHTSLAFSAVGGVLVEPEVKLVVLEGLGAALGSEQPIGLPEIEKKRREPEISYARSNARIARR